MICKILFYLATYLLCIICSYCLVVIFALFVMCRVFKYSICVDVRLLRTSARGDVQSAVATFYYYAKATSDMNDFNLSSIIETLNNEIDHFNLYSPWWDMDRILTTCVNAVACNP